MLEEDPPSKEWQIRKVFSDVLPERVNLAFNNMSDLRRDYISYLLGGATSIWTNLQLAEGLSRLLTAKKLEARMVGAIHRRENQPLAVANPPIVELPIRPEVRSAVLDGMQRVVTNGTATALRRAFRTLEAQTPGRDVFVFGKTGTPDILTPTSPMTGGALNRLVARYLEFENGFVRFREGDRQIFDPSDSTLYATLVSALRRTLAQGPGRYRGKTVERGILKALDLFHRQQSDLSWPTLSEVPTDLVSPVYLVAGRLRVNSDSPLFRQSLLKGKGAVFIFALASLPDRPGKPLPTVEALVAEEARVVTVAIHLELGPSSSVAVRAAAEVLPHLRHLLNP